MAFKSVGFQLVPGVNTEKTLSLNEAGISQSQAIRFKDGMVQTLGGWSSVYTTSPSTVREIHAWRDIAGTNWLATGGTQNLIAYTSTGSIDITPQTRLSSFTPSFSISSGSTLVQVNDPNSGVSIYDSVFFNTPIAIGNILLSNGYSIVGVLSTGSYQIVSSLAASTTISSGGLLPVFETISGSPTITGLLDNNNYQSAVGVQQSFYAPTVMSNITIQGPYDVTSIITSTEFTITGTVQANATLTSTMNAGLAQLNYYTVLGPQGTAGGFGAGGFGTGGFGIGTATTGIGATPISAIDWSLENWGEILLSCPANGGIYAWSSDSGFLQAQIVATAPFFNGGIFISQPQQILVAWKSTQVTTGTQDNLIVRWSDTGNYTTWFPTLQNAAGSFHLPTGSVIIGGLQAPSYGVIWTDVDVWIMQYVGGTVIFNFTRVGSGCGLIGQHAAGVIGGNVYWCGQSSFFTLGPNGAVPIACTVWDFIFQNLNAANANKVQCAPNSTFNEIAWFFPSANATECDSYVKYNIVEQVWDYGSMSRTTWIDVSVLGNPIGVDSGGTIWQHEIGQNYPGVPAPSFRTGWFNIADGEDLVFVDWVLPDFIWSQYSGTQNASVNITLYTVDYPGDKPRTYGPFTVSQATEYFNTRLRGRLVSVLVSSNNMVFWRLGRIRFRFAQSGRR